MFLVLHLCTKTKKVPIIDCFSVRCFTLVDLFSIHLIILVSRPNRSKQDLLLVSSHSEVFGVFFGHWHQFKAAETFNLFSPECAKSSEMLFGCDSALRCSYVNFNVSNVFPQLLVVFHLVEWNWFLVG